MIRGPSNILWSIHAVLHYNPIGAFTLEITVQFATTYSYIDIFNKNCKETHQNVN